MEPRPAVYEGSEPFIFISYAHADDHTVLPLIGGLQSRGFRVWYDAGIPDADHWQKVIAEHLKGSRCVIAFVSRAALESANCRKEINYAVNLSERNGASHATPIPVYLDNGEMDSEMEMVLMPLQARYYYKYASAEAFLDSLEDSSVLRLCRGEALPRWDTITFTGETATVSGETPEDWCARADELYNAEKYEEALVFFRKAAYRGYAKAQYAIGVCYEYGRGVGQDYAEAAKWYTMAAEQGNAAAQSNLASAYYFGRGVAASYNEAVKWFRLSAAQGHKAGQNGLGNCYYHGRGVEKDYAEAVKLYRMAAEQGSLAAHFNLGNAYYWGNGVEKDRGEAVKYYLVAAQKGHIGAQKAMGEWFWSGGPTGKSDYAEAARWFRMAAEQGDAAAQYRLGECYYHDDVKDYAQALEWFGKAKENGHKKAEIKFKFCEETLIESTGNPEDWYQLGLKMVGEMRGDKAGPLFEKAAQQGHVGAMYRWGLRLLPIMGRSGNREEGEKWIRKAAELGNVEAQAFLGQEYYIGRWCLRKDYDEAFKWLTLAARQGDTVSKYYLGLCYYYGYGTQRSRGDAYGWFFGAAVEDHDDAKYYLALCYEFGEGTAKNYRSAVDWYKKVAENPESDRILAAMCGLGRCYYFGGFGVTQDYAEAVSWFREAEKKSSGDRASFGECRYYLGNCYLSGKGVPQSYTEAKDWYLKAARHDHRGAEYNLGICFERGYGLEKRDLTKALEYYRLAQEHGHPKAAEAIVRVKKALGQA